MAEIIASGRRKQAPRVDMTPMVDLGFLLVTFFMLTTSFLKISSIDVKKPPKAAPKPLKLSRAITLIPMGKDSVLYYNGLNENLKLTFLNNTKHSLHQALQAKTTQVENDLNLPVDERKAVVIIKPASNCKLQTLVKVMDEINLVQLQNSYALVDLTTEENEKVKPFVHQ